MRVTTLLENHPHPERADLKFEHGLSFYIETDGQVYMSDVGTTDAFADNAAILGLDLARVEALAISHHHFDHGGGLPRFFEENKQGTVYLRKTAGGDCVIEGDPTLPRYVGLDKAVLAAHEDRIVYLDKDSEVRPGLHLLTEIPAFHPKPSGDTRLMVEREGQIQRDTFDHELITVLRGKDGLVVLTGCAHNGVLNMIEAVREAFPGELIQAVVGGFHLMKEDADTVRAVGEALLAMQIPAVYTGHCTGDAQTDLLAEVLGDRLHRLYSGLVMDF